MDGIASEQSNYLRGVSPRASEARSFSWSTGVFDAARRSYTDFVEGTIISPDHVVMATLRGGAERHEIVTDCGHRYDGPDRPGLVSFLPANCERRLKLHGVAWEWASIRLNPDLLTDDDDLGSEKRRTSLGLRPFSNQRDDFLFGMLGEMERLHKIDGALDTAYCDAMSFALAQYLRRHRDGIADAEASPPSRLPAWRLRRISDYVEAHLEDEIRIAVLASLVGVSEGHLHRAFRATTGQTPLQFINERRVRRAIRILAEEQVSIVELALRVGFVSPGHFARTFRRVTGVNPSGFCSGADMQYGKA